MQDIAKIYKAERKAEEQAQEQAEAELIRLRQEMVVPLLVALEDKIKKLIPEVPPLTTLGKALLYAAKVLPQVRNYAGSVYLTLDNNPIERMIDLSPWAIVDCGRSLPKNRLMKEFWRLHRAFTPLLRR